MWVGPYSAHWSEPRRVIHRRSFLQLCVFQIRVSRKTQSFIMEQFSAHVRVCACTCANVTCIKYPNHQAWLLVSYEYLDSAHKVLFFAGRSWVLNEATRVRVYHISCPLTLERSEEEQRMSLLILNFSVGFLQRMPLSSFILWIGHVFTGNSTALEIWGLGCGWLCPKLVEDTWVLLSSSVIIR